MALDESFKRPGTVPFKWEVQPGIPKQQDTAAAPGTAPAPGLPPATAPRLALPPAARVGALAPASCRRTSSSVASAPLSPPAPQPSPSPSHRRSMSARFATSLALMPLPFTRRGRGGGGGGGRAGAAKDDAAAEFCLLYAENKIV